MNVPSLLKGGWRFAEPGLRPRVAEYALTALLAFLAARILLSLLAPLPTPKGDALAAATAKPERERAVIVAANPFPQAPVSAIAASDVAPEVEDTSLDLTLTGVWPAEDGGSAIIRTPDGKQARFVVGDQIVSGARLAAVYADQVLIDRGGAREALRFEKKNVHSQTPAQQPAPAPTQTSPTQTSTAAQPFDLSSYVRFGPGTDASGKPAIAIYPGRSREAFERLGFRSRDILRQINGAPAPANPGALPALFESIVKSGDARIVVERGGVETTVIISLSSIGNGQ